MASRWSPEFFVAIADVVPDGVGDSPSGLKLDIYIISVHSLFCLFSLHGAIQPWALNITMNQLLFGQVSSLRSDSTL